MASITKPYTFTDGTDAVAAQVNADLDEVYNWVNGEAIHKDASTAFTAIPSGPATDPTTDNQFARKAYVDKLGIVGYQKLTTPSATFNADGYSDFVVNNVPVVQGHTYAVHLKSAVEYSTIDVDAHFKLQLRVNGVAVDEMWEFKTAALGVNAIPLDATVYWVAPATLSTDDFTVYVDEVVAGATVKFYAGATQGRYFTISSLGVL